MKDVSKLYDEISKEYESIYDGSNINNLLHNEKRLRTFLIEDFIINSLTISKDEILLDYGCGTGNTIFNLKKKNFEASMIGLDISKKMIDSANKKLDQHGYKNIEFVLVNEKNITFKANIIISIGVLGYQYNPKKSLYDLTNLVKNKGYLIFTSGNGDSILRSTRQFLSYLFNLITSKNKRRNVKFVSLKYEKIRNTLENAGFILIKKTYITYGLGYFPSSIGNYIDKILFKFLSRHLLGKYLSLSVIYVYKKIN